MLSLKRRIGLLAVFSGVHIEDQQASLLANDDPNVGFRPFSPPLFDGAFVRRCVLVAVGRPRVLADVAANLAARAISPRRWSVQRNHHPT
ncbi:hypothetical protein D3C72_2105970 [compost metagenome]